MFSLCTSGTLQGLTTSENDDDTPLLCNINTENLEIANLGGGKDIEEAGVSSSHGTIEF